MKELIQRLHEEQCSCVISNGETTRIFRQRGVADLYDLLKGEPDFLHGASIADKVIGKGAAALMILGGVKEIYADVISQPALSLLHDNGIKVSYDKAVDHIINRLGTGWCPVETLCNDVKTAPEILPLIEAFIEKNKQQKSATE